MPCKTAKEGRELRRLKDKPRSGMEGGFQCILKSECELAEKQKGEEKSQGKNITLFWLKEKGDERGTGARDEGGF